LNYEYEITDVMREHYEVVQNFRRILPNVKDIEKMSRQIVLRKIYPSSFYHLYKTVEIIQQLNVCLNDYPVLTQYLCSSFVKEKEHYYVETSCSHILNFLDTHFIIESCILPKPL
jgi:DNA mismatch repair ATPase MutS